MAEELKALLQALACTLGVGAAVFGGAYYVHTRPVTTDSYKIYHIPHGTAYCGEFYYTNCGIHLDRCTDGKTYVCLQNVMYEEDAKP